MTDLIDTPTTIAPAPYVGFERMPIDGEWRTGRSRHTAIDTDPWSGDTLLEIELANKPDLDDAFIAAKRSQTDWAARTPNERADVMRRAAAIMLDRKAEITSWLIREGGGTVAKADIEWGAVYNGFNEAASMPHHVEGRILPSAVPGKENRVYRVPVGVVVVISPWNFPMYLSNRSVAPALAVGNAVVLKPASDTPITGGLLLAKIYEEAGLPPGLLNVVVGSGHDIGDAIVSHPAPRVISFTGSTGVGERIPGLAGVKRLALELGGNGPMVILDDADLELAVDASVYGSFFHQGQICMIANRIVVDRSVHDEFVERFVDRVRALRVGDPNDPTTAIGPIINRTQLDSVLDKIKRAQLEGARVAVGGHVTGPARLSLPPHVLLGENHVATAREEVFGPVITVIRANDEADALSIANDTDKGLCSAVFTRDRERGVRFGLQIHAGMTHINDSPVNDDPNTAFGGEKASGIGRFGGQWAIEEFTTDHWISVQHQPLQYPI